MVQLQSECINVYKQGPFGFLRFMRFKLFFFYIRHSLSLTQTSHKDTPLFYNGLTQKPT